MYLIKKIKSWVRRYTAEKGDVKIDKMFCIVPFQISNGAVVQGPVIIIEQYKQRPNGTFYWDIIYSDKIRDYSFQKKVIISKIKEYQNKDKNEKSN